MLAPIDIAAEASSADEREATRVLLNAAPKVDPDAAGQTLQRSTVSFVDIQSDGQDREVWSDADIRAELRELRRMLLDGAAVTTAQSVDPGLRPYQVIDQLGNVIGESDTLGVLPDVVLSRGGYASLSSRLDSLADTPVYGAWLLQETRMRLRKMLLSESQQLSIAIIGDSYTQNASRYTQAVATTLQTTYGLAGVGWIGFGWYGTASGTWSDGSQPTGMDGSVRPDLVTVCKIIGTWTCSYNVGANNTPSLSKITSSTANDYVRFTVPANHDEAVLYYAGDGTGVIAVSWDDGSNYGSNINLDTVGSAHVSLGEPTAGTARIKVVSGNVTLAGVDLKSDDDGVRIHKLGGSGSNSGQWAAVTQATWAAQLLSLNPQLVIVLHGTNDQGSSFTPAASATNIGTIVANARSVLPYSDVLVATPAENQRTTNTYGMPDYATAHRAFAVANSCAYLDFQYFFGSPANNAFAYAYANSARPWYASDLIHPDPQTGGRVMADAILRLLTTSI